MIKPPLLLPRGVSLGPMIKWHHTLPLPGTRDLMLAEYALADEHGFTRLGRIVMNSMLLPSAFPSAGLIQRGRQSPLTGHSGGLKIRVHETSP
jgi:hypothetical protein